MSILDAAKRLTEEVEAAAAGVVREKVAIRDRFGRETSDEWVVTVVRRKRSVIREDSIVAPYNSGTQCPTCSGTGKV
jgi:hypothetical protein